MKGIATMSNHGPLHTQEVAVVPWSHTVIRIKYKHGDGSHSHWKDYDDQDAADDGIEAFYRIRYYEVKLMELEAQVLVLKSKIKKEKADV